MPCDLLFTKPSLGLTSVSPSVVQAPFVLSAPSGAGVPQRHPPALQHVPRPFREGVERGRELLRGDPVSVCGWRACGRAGASSPVTPFSLGPLSSFGHQDAVAALDALSRECCVTAGGRDGTVRVWKIPEESQLVFYGHQ